MTNRNYFEFHTDLLGFDFYLNGEYVPKFVLFWTGYKAIDILTGKTNLKLTERI